MKGRGTWIALGLLVLLGAYVAVFERGEVREPGTSPPVSEMVGMKPEDVTRVELQHDGQSIALAKTGKQWRVEKPVKAAADGQAVQQMLEGLLKGTVDQVVADKVSDLKQYGLDKPALQLTLTDAKGRTKTLQTGVKDVRGFSVYARAADKPELFLLSSYQVEEVQKKKPEDLRDKTALAVDPNAATRLTLQAPTGTLRVEKQAGKWQLTGPRPAPADPDAVQQVLDSVKNLRVDRFESEGGDLARYGLAQPRLTLTVSGPGGDKGLLLGKPTADGKDLYAARQGEREVFQLPKNTLDDLSKKPGDLRDKTLLSFKRDDARKITITTPARTLELTHSAKEWRLTKPIAAKTKDEKLSSLLFTLEVVKGSHVIDEKPVDLAKYGLDRPQLKVEVALPRGPQMLEIGKQTDKNEYFARSNGQEAVFTVPDFTLTDLKVSPVDLAAGK
jgi:hypothetical protein